MRRLEILNHEEWVWDTVHGRTYLAGIQWYTNPATVSLRIRARCGTTAHCHTSHTTEQGGRITERTDDRAAASNLLVYF